MKTVSDLRQLQCAIRRGLYENHQPLDMIEAAPGRTAEECLNVHRRTWMGARLEAVVRTFPVIGEILGESCWRALARDYVAAHPSRSDSLDDYPSALPNWLDSELGNYRYLSDFGYLPDLARFEWALYSVQLAEGDRIMDVHAFSRIPPDRQAAASLQLADTVALLRSSYPVYLIWLSHQPEPDIAAESRIGTDTRAVVVFRSGWRSQVCALSIPEYGLLVQLAGGATLEYLHCYAEANDLTLEQWLTWLMRNRCISGYWSTFRAC